jgi:hypothetical protein
MSHAHAHPTLSEHERLELPLNGQDKHTGLPVV